MLNFFKKKNKEQIFWDWFVKNKSRLEKFIENPDKIGYDIYHQLSKQLKKYNLLLFPEITVQNGKYVLIITPDGMKDGVEPTIKLVDSRPEIDNWEIKKFRQPKDDIHLSINGVSFPYTDIKIIPYVDEEREKVDIQVFIKNMKENEKAYQHLAFLYFDHVLGEYNTITKVGYIDFNHMDEGDEIPQAIDLIELRKLIIEEFY